MPDTVLHKFSKSDTLEIRPGAAVGTLVLKTLISDSLWLDLGRPDSSDAAMCKSWSMWYWGDRELDLFSVCDPEVDMQKTLKIIRVRGFRYRILQEGIHLNTSSELAEIQAQFPQGRLVDMGPEGIPNTHDLYQDTTQGIAFELNAEGKQAGVLIFPKGTSLEHQYIPAIP